jgi:hypothetical protein
LGQKVEISSTQHFCASSLEVPFNVTTTKDHVLIFITQATFMHSLRGLGADAFPELRHIRMTSMGSNGSGRGFSLEERSARRLFDLPAVALGATEEDAAALVRPKAAPLGTFCNKLVIWDHLNVRG